MDIPSIASITSITSAPDKHIPNIILGFILLICVCVIGYYLNVYFLKQRQCDQMNDRYGAINGYMSSMTKDDPNCGYKLNEYYVATAYNCCSGGSYKNDFVSTCNLKAIIRQGVRCLDFEIYSVNNNPVIATSTVDDYFVKETYNYVDFGEAMRVIDSVAFSGGTTCPNPLDPLIIHLRIKSNNVNIFQKMADIFKQFSPRMLGKQFSFENGNQNIGNARVLDLMGKCIIVVDRSNLNYLQNESFLEYVNLTSGSMFMRKYDFDGIKHIPDTTELTNYNRRNMTIVLPNSGGNPSNPVSLIGDTYGCQMTAMRYQLNDNYLQLYTKLFNEAGYAFRLKPESLRFKPVVVPEPTPQDPALSYATRKAKTDYYDFNF
jgi:hypothetical protein